jgi:demethylmenaquinone methyltransferase/2-methoxy-6-polyprenyl-1,4-benzoquinol methylase
MAGSYDRLSPWYDLLSSPWEARPIRIGLQTLALCAGESVIEVGCGTGRALVAMARSVGGSGRTLGVDRSVMMCSVSQSRIARLGLSDRAGAASGDALSLPCSSGSLDAAFMSFTLELFSDDLMPRVLAECRRVLRPQGRLCVVAMSRPGARGLMSRAYSWAQARWPTWVDCRPIDAPRVIEASSYGVVTTRATRMAGLPVEIVLARSD